MQLCRWDFPQQSLLCNGTVVGTGAGGKPTGDVHSGASVSLPSPSSASLLAGPYHHSALARNAFPGCAQKCTLEPSLLFKKRDF